MDGKVYLLFEQCKVFSVDDENMSADVRIYLRNVRNETLITNAISRDKNKKKKNLWMSQMPYNMMPPCKMTRMLLLLQTPKKIEELLTGQWKL